MDEHREHLIASVVARHRTIMRSLFVKSTSAWLTLDLTYAQIKVLLVLSDEGSISVGGVAERLGITVPTASHLIDRLVQTGYVTRTEDPADRRRTLVQLSTKGETLLVQLFQSGRGSYRAWLEQLSDDELRALDDGLAPLARMAARAEGG